MTEHERLLAMPDRAAAVFDRIREYTGVSWNDMQRKAGSRRVGGMYNARTAAWIAMRALGVGYAERVSCFCLHRSSAHRWEETPEAIRLGCLVASDVVTDEQIERTHP